jgi:nicotinate phosphoribosyltransferase
MTILIKETKRAFLSPSRVESLLVPIWMDGKVCTENIDTVETVRERVKTQLDTLRGDIKRLLNPTPYKVLLFFF